ncbi:MAG: hypothetical protein AAFZ65_20535, partial [Planctomycetota bacterium]
MKQAPAPLFVALLAGSLLGLGLGALVFGGGSTAPAETPVAGVAASPSGRSTAPRAADPTVLARPRLSSPAQSASVDSARVAREDLAKVEAVAASVRREASAPAALEGGDGEVRGLVIDAEGE